MDSTNQSLLSSAGGSKTTRLFYYYYFTLRDISTRVAVGSRASAEKDAASPRAARHGSSRAKVAVQVALRERVGERVRGAQGPGAASSSSLGRPRKAPRAAEGPALLLAPPPVAAASGGQGPTGTSRKPGSTMAAEASILDRSPPPPRSPSAPPRSALRQRREQWAEAACRAPDARARSGRAGPGARAAGGARASADGGGWCARPKLT